MGVGGQLKGQPQLLLLCAAARHRSNAMTEHSLMHLPYRGILSGVIFYIGRYRYGIFWPLSGPPDMLPIISCILTANCIFFSPSVAVGTAGYRAVILKTNARKPV